MREPKSLLSAVDVFDKSHIDPHRNVDLDPGQWCDRISLASHRQLPPKILEQPQDVVASGGWPLFRMYYGLAFTSRVISHWIGFYNNGGPHQPVG